MVDHRLWPLHLQGLGAGEKQQYGAANTAVLALATGTALTQVSLSLGQPGQL